MRLLQFILQERRLHVAATCGEGGVAEIRRRLREGGMVTSPNRREGGMVTSSYRRREGRTLSPALRRKEGRQGGRETRYSSSQLTGADSGLLGSCHNVYAEFQVIHTYILPHPPITWTPPSRPTPPLYPTPQTPSSLAWDKLRYHSRGAAHPLRSCRKSAPPRLTGLRPLVFFYCIQPAP